MGRYRGGVVVVLYEGISPLNDFHAPKVMVTCVGLRAARPTCPKHAADRLHDASTARSIVDVHAMANVDACRGTATTRRRMPVPAAARQPVPVRDIRSQAILAFSQAPRWYVARAT
jgi:hypothetical protein